MYFRALSSSTNAMSLNRVQFNQPRAVSSQTGFSNQGDVFSNSQKTQQTEQPVAKPALKFSGWASGILAILGGINTGAAAGKNIAEFFDGPSEPRRKHRSKRSYKPRYETVYVDVYRHGRYHHTERQRRRIN